MPSNRVAWVEGEAQAKDIIFALADEIVGAKLPFNVNNRWEKVLESKSTKWVTYKKNSRDGVAGVYRHTNGKQYPVIKLKNNLGLTITNSGTPVQLVDDNGFVYETVQNSTANVKTGRKFQVNTFTVDGNTILVPNALAVLVDDPENKIHEKQAWIVTQKKLPLLGGDPVSDSEWNEFQLVCKMPDDWTYLLKNGTVNVYYSSYTNSSNTYWANTTMGAGAPYTFTETFYTADVTNTADDVVVLKSVPDVPAGVSPATFYIMLQAPVGQYNYFNVSQGEGFSGVPAGGESESTYIKACDISTVKVGGTPTIINQKEAEKQYLLQTDPMNKSRFQPPTVSWVMDGNIPVVSPPAHFFYGADSTVTWLANKKRRADYWVGYWLSINNNRVSFVLEGDPAPDMDAYYRTFGYLGKITPFADYDHTGNFGITVGMGQLTADRTGFLPENIKPDKNTIYAGYGRYTSNGMTSVSMLRTRSSVLFQAYYPAFITQLPNYSGVGTIPPELSTLIIEKSGFQASAWTDRYHASPIYLVHQYEGYRGYLEGVVAINDHNLINMDELVVDTEEWKDPEDHSKGTWTEVYKFFSVKSDVNFLKSSANPDECSVALLKEIR
ncbi:hypothetical protein A3844_06070 [Paenibacillus helianthi]|uniref:DUF5704 domain-containing protein n=1 Tax=Paenibacillus helianthi TaxID=1349432 RepID=A0ABX3EVD8_9BACL|nr:hypothetical protein [Paenibacillus helianthi]OKP89545.1 hypothetical protein A3844_06070 [Paenibacillus helianthi]